MKAENTDTFNFEFEGHKKIEVSKNDVDTIVMVDNVITYQFDQKDRTSFRHAIIQLYQSGLGTQKMLGSVFNVTNRSISSWLQKYKAGGIDALNDNGVGSPIKIDAELRNKIRLARASKLKYSEIAKIFKISQSRVHDIVNDKSEDISSATLLDDDFLAGPDEINEDKTEVSEQKIDVVPELTDDPLDRKLDRQKAYAGIINDAEPLFSSTKHLENAGSLLAVSLLSFHSYFSIIDKIYKSIGPAFYGLRTIFMIMFLMAVTRKKSADVLGKGSPEKLGRLAGLDRSPCTKIMRNKVKQLAHRGKGFELMQSVGEYHVEESSNSTDIILYTDGHIKHYHGKKKLGKSFSTSANRVVKGSTDYWLNLGDSTPLLCIPTEFNSSMFDILPDVVEDAKKVCKNRRITIVFDRGGSSALTYEKLINLDVDFVAYNKSPKAIDDKLFIKEKVVINKKEFDYLPYSRNITLDIYEKDKKKAKYKKTDRNITLREVVVRTNNGKQVAILTNREDLTNIEVPSVIFNRWTQENFFKYLKANYALDSLSTYKTVKVSSDIDHPNPEYVNCEKKVKKINTKIKQILLSKFNKLETVELIKEDKIIDLFTGKKGDELKGLIANKMKLKEVLETTDKRESAESFERLNFEHKLILNVVKMTAYHIEGMLAKIIKPYNSFSSGEERDIISTFIHSTGKMKVAKEHIKITLEKQATPKDTNLLKILCDTVNKKEPIYPGTKLKMIFDVN